jgi:hypothetical protein
MTASKYNLADWLYEALRDSGGSGTIVDVCKHIWTYHEADLRAAA